MFDLSFSEQIQFYSKRWQHVMIYLGYQSHINSRVEIEDIGVGKWRGVYLRRKKSCSNVSTYIKNVAVRPLLPQERAYWGSKDVGWILKVKA